MYLRIYIPAVLYQNKKLIIAGVAQLVEQRIRNAQVTCSSHATSSMGQSKKTVPIFC